MKKSLIGDRWLFPDIVLTTVVLLMCASLIGCGKASKAKADAGVDGGADAGTLDQLDGVDILLVVESGISPDAWRVRHATSLFSLLTQIVDPLSGSSYDAIDDLRLAVVTTDLSYSWAGIPCTEENGAPPDLDTSWGPMGDEGRFVLESGDGDVTLIDEAIPCDASSVQCPSDWLCSDIGEDGIGACAAPNWNDTSLTCPASLAEAGASWIDPVISGSTSGELALHAACLANVGWGCGWKQQLQSTKMALTREDQADFVRDGKLLAIIVFTDDNEGSIEDGPGLFATDDFQDRHWLAAGNHPEFLYPVSHFHDAFAAIKDQVEGTVLFAAITGVPQIDACQGSTFDAGDCLADPAMQFVETQGTSDSWSFEPACAVPSAYYGYPARRLVELAGMYGELGYVTSICNTDWSPAMSEIGEMICARLVNDDL